jgi:SAM-dependent methyltransferase
MEDLLPLADASIDRLLVIHALENAVDVQGLMREAWRVLAAGGRMIVVVPSRGSLWALRDNNPFAQGRPYSRRQLNELMRQAAFTPVAWSEALWMPPWGRLVVIRSGPVIEKVGRSLSLPMAGLNIVEATKQVYRPVTAPVSRYALPTWGGILVPQPSARRMDE